MTTLIRTEISRLLARRLVRVMLLATLGGIVLAAVIVFFNSSTEPYPVADDPFLEREIQRCERGRYGPLPGEDRPGFDVRQACSELVGIPDKRFHLEQLPGILMGTSVPFILLGWVFGASFIGAEWQKGTITTGLTWEPRRVRLFVAKLAAALATIAFLFVALQLILGIAFAPSAIFRGTTTGVDGRWVMELVGVLLRGAGVAAVGAAIAFSIAMVGRNTGAALGAGFFYGAIAEELLRAWKPGWAPWLFKDNAARFIAGHEVGFPEVGRTTVEAGLLLALYALILAVAAAAFFRRRDVT